ncbi:hypothetical protein ACIB24_17050 [Spongisporangium articulatum]|uniref:Secreted protein n=1 Tax=Spongisporangium articulatum TaxID=3362603 RepID=A0ABW8AQX4_9ACTN
MRIIHFPRRAAVALVAGTSLLAGLLVVGDGTANAAEPTPAATVKSLAQAVLPCDYVKKDPGAWIATDGNGKTFANDPYNVKTQLAVERPAVGAEAAVDANGQITLSGVLAFKAKFLNASVGRVTAAKADVTVGGLGSTGDYRVWLKSWKAKLRPTRLGTQDLCVQAQETDLIRGHVYRPVTVADHIAPGNVRGLGISGVTDARAVASWDAATDNFGLAGYDVSISVPHGHRDTAGFRGHGRADRQ